MFFVRMYVWHAVHRIFTYPLSSTRLIASINASLLVWMVWAEVVILLGLFLRDVNLPFIHLLIKSLISIYAMSKKGNQILFRYKTQFMKQIHIQSEYIFFFDARQKQVLNYSFQINSCSFCSYALKIVALRY